MTMREVRLFGALQEFGETSAARLRFDVPDGITARELREYLAKELGSLRGDRAKGLVLDSAIADEKRVLNDADLVPSSGELSLLPPVCGG